MQETVLITGGSGLVGIQLTQLLINKGYRVQHISRKAKQNINIPSFKWDLTNNFWDKEAIVGVDYIIHLAGANVAEGRWTTKKKQEILKSRVVGSKIVYEMVIASNGKIKGVVSASAVGFYGSDNSSEILDESANQGNDFLANVCVQWENTISLCNTKVTILRTGVVLSRTGGAIPKMLAPINWGLGSPLGSGFQLMPWIHIDDLCKMYIFALENKLEGIYNAVAPQVITNKELTTQLAKTVNRKIILPNVPSIVLKLMLGEMSQMLLNGVNVSSNKIQNAGFSFSFSTVSEALQHIFKSKQ